MAQTTGALNSVNGKVELSADGESWTDVSGSTNKVEQPIQEADSGDVGTLDGPYKIVTVGKFNPIELGITVLFEDLTISAGAWAFFKARKAVTGMPIWVRYSPAGGNVGDERFTTANASENPGPGKIKSFSWPGADASQAGPTVLVMKVRCTTLISDTVSA